ncbi:MAG: hypothetical protein JWN72_2816 [Thermoleophilia bacterium]|nr:hypothetical protein [Thermoleophilia bacterium]
MDELRKRRMARNEARFRDVNRSVVAGIDKFVSNDPKAVYTLLCECSLETCAVMLQVRYDEYRAVRNVPERFFVQAGHEVPEIEVVVQRTDRFSVIEKIGVGAKVARERDEEGTHG